MYRRALDPGARLRPVQPVAQFARGGAAGQSVDAVGIAVAASHVEVDEG